MHRQLFQIRPDAPEADRRFQSVVNLKVNPYGLRRSYKKFSLANIFVKSKQRQVVNSVDSFLIEK